MGFLKRNDELERELRAQRPEPRRELVDAITSRIVGDRRRRSRRPLRLGVAVALSAGMFGALGAFGGLGYAANGVTRAVSSAVHVVTPTRNVVPSTAVSSAMAQYKVALCFHGHTLNVDSHAVHALEANGAKPGPCGRGAFKPAAKTVVACFKGNNVSIAKSSVKTKSQRAKLAKLGITPGYCKT
jgi:hypothetical protein